MPEVEFVVFEPVDCRMSSWFSGLPNVQTRATPIPSEGRWRKLFISSWFWSKALRQESFDLFEGFHLPLPKTNAAKTILTIHDVRRLHSDWDWLSRTAFRHALIGAIRNTDMVVTVSEAMRQELLPYCGRTPVCVIPNGLEVARKEAPPAEEEQEALRRKLSLPENFLLAVGHFERRKNYPRLIEALVHLRNSGHPCHLLIVGNESGEKTALETKIASVGLANNVTLASGLSDMEVRCAYDLCELFVFPSTYEGFGIPILEAMAAGKPMVLSDIPVFREITADQAIYFSPYDAKDIAKAIEHALSLSTETACCFSYGLERFQSYAYSSIRILYQELYSQIIDNLDAGAA